jgi:hypothetical protein
LWDENDVGSKIAKEDHPFWEANGAMLGHIGPKLGPSWGQDSPSCEA